MAVALTLGDMISDALRKAGVIREGQNPSAEQTRDAIDTFNGLMSAWAADNIDLGDFPVDVVGDELDLEREHKESVKILFAVALQADHGLPPDPYLIAQAGSAIEFLMRNTFVRPAVQMIVPTGRAKNSGFDIENG